MENKTKHSKIKQTINREILIIGLLCSLKTGMCNLIGITLRVPPVLNSCEPSCLAGCELKLISCTSEILKLNNTLHDAL